MSNRRASEAVRYPERTGCPWRDVPAVYGPWHTTYMRWQRWVEAGVPQKAMTARYLEAVKSGELGQNLALLDATIGRAHSPAVGSSQQKMEGHPRPPNFFAI